MSLSKGFAAALWAIRSQRKISQVDLGNALSQKQVYLVEQGESTLTISKLDGLAAVLGVHPATLIALGASADGEKSARQILERALLEVEDFEAKGGMALLQQRMSGKIAEMKLQESKDKLLAVQACKTRGMTQRETATELKMARSTVSYFWNKGASD